MVLTQEMIKDAARSRSRHHSPHHMQTVPGPLHPLYLNYPFPNYPPAGVASHPLPVNMYYVAIRLLIVYHNELITVSSYVYTIGCKNLAW